MSRYEWDERKNQSNLQRHGLSFHDAAIVFEGDTISFIDDREDYGEERYITLGLLRRRVVIVVHTQRSAITLIISMRKANEREKKIYFERLKEIR